MIVFPNAKINIGLQVLRKRADHYHELETVFYPIKICDVLEIIEAPKLSFHPSGIIIEGNEEENICMKAYHILAKDFDLPAIAIYLHKVIPVGAGLGGGSSDAAFLIKALNDRLGLLLSTEKMQDYARQLGADCAFFIQNQPVFAEGIGDKFTDINLDLSAYHFVIVKPKIHISTQEAYQLVVPDDRGKSLSQHIKTPIEDWKNTVINDFEVGIFRKFPEIREIKEEMYHLGALYASMSGSGSAIFGIFIDKPVFPENQGKYEVFYC
jgi:4-diphosphocytidyl-2-C-methyl-D-erythritol kinase